MAGAEALRFTATVEAVPRTRRWVVDWARRAGAPDHQLRVLALLTTEAVTNAVKHGPDEGEVTVAVSVAGGGWRVAVTDGSPQLPAVRQVGPQASGGRGVMLIDRLAADWGVERHDGAAKTVWFRVA